MDYRIHSFFKDLSYAGIVIALSFEFVPAELVLPLAGYWVYLGDMKLILTILAGTVGGTFGPLTLYALGRFGADLRLLSTGSTFSSVRITWKPPTVFLRNTATA